jgi:hypothetical protein
MDGCSNCDEKNTTIEFQQNQLDSIRLLIENDVKTNGNNPISVRYHDLYAVVDDIMGILEI